MPSFREYMNAFSDIIKTETNIKADYEVFKDTSIYERYMLNAAQFSAAKDVATNGMIKTVMFDDEGVRQGYSAFKRDAEAITDIVNDVWLRTEYDTAVRQAVAGQQFSRYRDDADLYPYWRYLRTISLNPRDEHLLLVDKIFRIGDYEGDMCFPPNGYNCGCGSEQLDDQYLKDNELSALTNEQSKEELNKVDSQFRFNPADQGILPKEGHSYFQALPNANAADGNTFGITRSTKNVDKLSAKGLHLILKKVDEWKHEYHSDHNTITFQNSATLANIVFTHKALLAIEKHSAGFEQLADTVTKPDEIWSTWVNVDEQRDVKRVYIRGNYCVMTTNGNIIDAYLVDNVNRFRKGVII